MNYTIFSTISIINIFILVFSTFNLFRRRNIVNLLAAFSVLSFAMIEASKFFLLFDARFADKIFGLGIALSVLFMIMLSSSFLPSKGYSVNRIILSPIFGFISLVFFLVWWIKPFITQANLAGGGTLGLLARYFFVVVVFDFALSLSNLERGFYYAKSRNIKLLLASALFIAGPYILLAVYAVLFSQINYSILGYSSVSVLIGGIIFLALSVEGLSLDTAKEGTAVHTSLVLFLLGGYLFFVGAFIKLFQKFGWNLHTLFSFLTTAFIFLALFMLILSSSFKERIKKFLFRNLTRQKYDWQKIWEEFTYKISLVTDMEMIKKNIAEAISKIMDIPGVKVFIFADEAPFEAEFSKWLLRQAQAFIVSDVFNNGFSVKYPGAARFFKENNIDSAVPLYGEKKVIGIIGLSVDKGKLPDKELLKVLSLQASSVILNSRANQKLHESQKRESIYRLSTFVIHDVKNYISNLSLLLANKDKFTKPEFLKDAFFTLESTVGKMKHLMEEFKSLRGDIVLNKKKCGLKGIVKQALDDLSPSRTKNIEVSSALDDVSVEADSSHINRVLLNLFINACEAMGDSGRLYVKTAKEGGFGCILVKDTGCGMSPEFIKNKLFRPFSTTKHKGLGIGLYQCKMIIEAHGGKIEVESKEGEGTTFKVLLPA